MKTLYIALGTLSLALGILGIFLPLLPTTPFLLLTAALYFKSSPRLYNWLLNHKHLGPYIRNFRENKAIPLRAKIISISLMWITMLYCVFFIIPYIWVKVILLIIAAGVTWKIQRNCPPSVQCKLPPCFSLFKFLRSSLSKQLCSLSVCRGST